ncbi:hypothetical protein FOZ61_004003 [Perkinsus olseni]|uniref:Uncharacterized protein n=1 Tax=Perkinsus olseni TaxID=32597 RepID=A0A7J6LMG7_PEROL|nr:hypothetical protein FOZ61_004003 [Perkinsus olseni]KAF4664133.1 hypothetical protein FOL46_004390 [Perkinsus olseni]
MAWFTYVPHNVFYIFSHLYLEEIVALLIALTVSLSLVTANHVLTDADLFWWTIMGCWASLGCALLYKMGVLCNPRFAKAPEHDEPSVREPDDYSKFGAPAQVERDVILDGTSFRDSAGRRVHLRGINVGGMSKMPIGSNSSQSTIPYGEGATFVGRPFALEEADVHLQRLRAWGLTFLRFIVTWEALEPRVPGEYDTEYIQYLVEIIRKCREYGISVLIDPHQDAWSRWTGGDGAPRWTLEKIGFDPEKLSESGACFLHQCHLADESDPKGFFPKMSWPVNNLFYPAATMWAIFFAGEDYAPKTKIGDENAGAYLRRHYYGAVSALAEALKGEPNVLGFETLNEPNMGWVGRTLSLDKFNAPQPLGYLMSPWETIQLANGESLKLPKYGEDFKYLGHFALNEHHTQVFLPGYRDPWNDNGVWDYDANGKMRLLKKRYFDLKTKEDFQTRYMRPFWRDFAEAVTSKMPDGIIFLGPTMDMEWPKLHVATKDDVPEDTRIVWAPHWYDGPTLQYSNYRTWLGCEIATYGLKFDVGPGVAPNTHKRCLRNLKASGKDVGPTLLGEVGIPWCGDYGSTDRAMNDTMEAVESSNLQAVTVWNYVPSNTKEMKDGWNKEDLSIFTSEPNPRCDSNGGPHLRMPSVVRPYAFKLAGKLVSARFDGLHDDKCFIMRFEQDPTAKTNRSEIFVPLGVHYPRGIDIEVSDGSYELDKVRQTLTFSHDPQILSHWLCIRHRPCMNNAPSSRMPASKLFASSPLLEARA